jgi:hypothetical protein
LFFLILRQSGRAAMGRAQIKVTVPVVSHAVRSWRNS